MYFAFICLALNICAIYAFVLLLHFTVSIGIGLSRPFGFQEIALFSPSIRGPYQWSWSLHYY